MYVHRDLAEAESLLASLESKVTQALTLKSSAVRQAELCASSISDLQKKVDLCDRVCVFLRKLIDSEVESSIRPIERLQNEALRAVFSDQDLSVKANVDVHRGKVHVDLFTVEGKSGKQIQGHTLDGFGGAVATLQSLLLRIALIFQRGMRPVLFLDETLSAVDDGYVVPLVTFLKALAKRLHLKILLVTHNPVVISLADRSYQVSISKGNGSEASYFERIG